MGPAHRRNGSRRWIWRCRLLEFLTGPGMSLKRGLQRRLRDASGIVRDRGRGDDGDDLESMILTEAGRDESIDLFIVKTPTLFDHRSCQSRQRSEFAVPGHTTLTNGLYIRWINSFLERQSRMERD